jgi:hypothetical protein
MLGKGKVMLGDLKTRPSFLAIISALLVNKRIIAFLAEQIVNASKFWLRTRTFAFSLPFECFIFSANFKPHFFLFNKLKILNPKRKINTIEAKKIATYA